MRECRVSIAMPAYRRQNKRKSDDCLEVENRKDVCLQKSKRRTRSSCLLEEQSEQTLTVQDSVEILDCETQHPSQGLHISNNDDTNSGKDVLDNCGESNYRDNCLADGVGNNVTNSTIVVGRSDCGMLELEPQIETECHSNPSQCPINDKKYGNDDDDDDDDNNNDTDHDTTSVVDTLPSVVETEERSDLKNLTKEGNVNSETTQDRSHSKLDDPEGNDFDSLPILKPPSLDDEDVLSFLCSMSCDKSKNNVKSSENNMGATCEGSRKESVITDGKMCIKQSQNKGESCKVIEDDFDKSLDRAEPQKNFPLSRKEISNDSRHSENKTFSSQNLRLAFQPPFKVNVVTVNRSEKNSSGGEEETKETQRENCSQITDNSNDWVHASQTVGMSNTLTYSGLSLKKSSDSNEAVISKDCKNQHTTLYENSEIHSNKTNILCYTNDTNTELKTSVIPTCLYDNHQPIRDATVLCSEMTTRQGDNETVTLSSPLNGGLLNKLNSKDENKSQSPCITTVPDTRTTSVVGSPHGVTVLPKCKTDDNDEDKTDTNLKTTSQMTIKTLILSQDSNCGNSLSQREKICSFAGYTQDYKALSLSTTDGDADTTNGRFGNGIPTAYSFNESVISDKGNHSKVADDGIQCDNDLKPEILTGEIHVCSFDKITMAASNNIVGSKETDSKVIHVDDFVPFKPCKELQRLEFLERDNGSGKAEDKMVSYDYDGPEEICNWKDVKKDMDFDKTAADDEKKGLKVLNKRNCEQGGKLNGDTGRENMLVCKTKNTKENNLISKYENQCLIFKSKASEMLNNDENRVFYQTENSTVRPSTNPGTGMIIQGSLLPTPVQDNKCFNFSSDKSLRCGNNAIDKEGDKIIFGHGSKQHTVSSCINALQTSTIVGISKTDSDTKTGDHLGGSPNIGCNKMLVEKAPSIESKNIVNITDDQGARKPSLFSSLSVDGSLPTNKEERLSVENNLMKKDTTVINLEEQVDFVNSNHNKNNDLKSYKPSPAILQLSPPSTLSIPMATVERNENTSTSESVPSKISEKVQSNAIVKPSENVLLDLNINCSPKHLNKTPVTVSHPDSMDIENEKSVSLRGNPDTCLQIQNTDDGMDMLMMMMSDSQLWPRQEPSPKSREVWVMDEKDVNDKHEDSKQFVDGKREEGKCLVKMVLDELVAINRQLLRLKRDMDATKRKLQTGPGTTTSHGSSSHTTTTGSVNTSTQHATKIAKKYQQQQQVPTMFKKMTNNLGKKS